MKSVQEAGDNSQQVTAGRDINMHGLTVCDANELINLHVEKLRTEFTLEAFRIAEDRIKQFEEKLVVQLNSKGLLDKLKNTGFQQNVFDASRAVVCSDNQGSEDFLVHLLLERASDHENQSIKIAISKAIQITDKLDGSTLIGLTAEWAMLHLRPMVFDFEVEWASIRSYQVPFVQEGLPPGTQWQDDLDGLDLLRLEPTIVSRIRYKDIIQNRFAPYLVPGIPPKEFNQLKPELDLLDKNLRKLIIPHPLVEGNIMLNAKSKEDFDTKLALLNDSAIIQPVMLRLIELNRFGTMHSLPLEHLNQKIEADELLSKYAEWWNGLVADRITSPGKVIGFLNAKRFIAFKENSIKELFR